MGQALDIVCHSALSLERFDSLLEMLSSLPFGTPLSPATAWQLYLDQGQVDKWIRRGASESHWDSGTQRGRDC